MRTVYLTVMIFTAVAGFAQKKKVIPAAAPVDASTILFSQTKYRLVGPFRGGRSGAVTGSIKNKQLFYTATTGGGVWKTTDGGSNWKNISDKYFGGTMGAIAVAPSDENILYAGEGENTMRGNVSEGLGGLWRSEDGGRSWTNIGLKDSRHIVRILVHPRNPDIVWVAVMGHLFGPNEERGVYKTVDGGKTWRRTLFVNNQTGASELVMEPGNPMTLYAGTWRVIRTPYSLESGGAGSGLWKSTDGGETWNNITRAKGLPAGVWGIVGVAIAPSNPDKIYALVENANGGLYASSDAGESWSLQNSSGDIRQRAWYYSKIFVDPQNEQKVYVLNVEFNVSADGGKTFSKLNTPHSDHHDLWIDPENGQRMIIADDGGAQISYDGGQHWSTYENQPTAQIYRVSTDNSFPYRILGAQQDNSTLRIRHRSYGSEIGVNGWEPTAGSESGYVVADPSNPDIVYGGNYGGYLSRLDHRTGENRAISVWPDNPMGAGADVQKYRFQWNFPIFFSPHNPKRLYAAGNALFVTENEGASWEQLSPDLTTNDKSRQRSSGGPITQDNTSVEYYCTIFTATESALEKDLLWTGSDDGLVYLSRDAGKHWDNVTPAQAPKWMMWNAIETHPTRKGVAYLTGTRYKLDDFTPYIYKTTDYGKTWALITRGIAANHFTRVMRCDHQRDGLLYAGTEYGMYISYDDGLNWKPFQLNLPVVPVTDLSIRENSLIVATQGRAFWMIDELGPVQQYDASIPGKPIWLYAVNEAWRIAGPEHPAEKGSAPVNAGANPLPGVVVHYYLGQLPSDSAKDSIIRLTILDAKKQVVDTYTTGSREHPLDARKGMNVFNWNLLYPAGKKIEGMILWNGVPGSVVAPPGRYFVRIALGKDSMEQPFTVKADPNYKLTQPEYEAQFDFLRQVQAKFNEIQQAILETRALRSQLSEFTGRLGGSCPAEVQHAADSLFRQLTAIEEQLYQTKARSGQDVLNYPIRLNDKLAGVFNAANSGNMAPSKQSREVYAELAGQADVQLGRFRNLKQEELEQFNELVRQRKLPLFGVSQ